MANKKPNLRREWQERLKPIDRLDKEITAKLSVCANSNSIHSDWRFSMIVLEISCHGLLWLPLCIVLLWFSQSKSFQQVVVNLFTALILDCIFVAVIKAAVRRGRPSNNKNDMFVTIGLDNYAFPSGHASRAVMLGTVFLKQNVGGFIFSRISVFWAAAVCLSRVLLGRHHVGDVLAGILLGFFEAWLIHILWFGENTSQSILKIFSLFQMFTGADVDVI